LCRHPFASLPFPLPPPYDCHFRALSVPSLELFYQQTLRLFSNTHPFSLEPAPSVVDLALLGLEESPSKCMLPMEDKRKCAQVCSMCIVYCVWMGAGGGGGETGLPVVV
jgi:hypothetical protein